MGLLGLVEVDTDEAFANRYVLELCANLEKDVKGSVDPIKLLGSVEKSLFEYHSGNRT